MRGLIRLPQVATEVPEGHFSGHGIPPENMESKPQTGLPSLQHQIQKGTQIASICEKQQGFCQPCRDGWRHREPLKGPKQKILFVATYFI